MRDFRREVKAASELAAILPATEFSWSLTRHLQFRHCERGYFLKYYFAQGGWDRYAESAVRLAYAAKKSVSYAQWLGDLTNRALKESFDSIRFLSPGRRFRRFRDHFEDCILVELDRIGEADIHDFPLHGSDLLRKARFDLAGAFRCLCSSPVFEMLLKMQRSNFINRNEDYECYCDGTRIWFDPGVRWQEPGCRSSLRIQYSPFAEELCRSAADLFAYYIRNRFGAEKAVSFFLAREEEDWQAYRFCGNAEFAEKMIRKSIAAMKEKILPGNMVRCSDFPELGVSEACRGCKYCEACAALREIGV